jgi:TLC domain
MLDPIPAPAPFLFDFVKPYADAISLPTLPYHIHEVLFALIFYQTIESLVSPVFSTYAFPSIYPKLNRRTRVNWDVHVVSMVQSCLINVLALWLMFVDKERKDMNALERVYGYTGGCGMIQGLAAGYFLWDVVVSTRYFKIFGLGIWAHAVSALFVFSLGFMPFLNFYGPVFILYELSSPFLNVHWFCDKLGLTGSKLQWYNGVILLATFFGCRLVWGTYQSLRVYQDVWAAMHLDTSTPGHLDVGSVMHNITNSIPIFSARDGQMCLGEQSCVAAQAEVMKFAGPGTDAIPLWLAIGYLSCNLLLNSLNFYWFGRMVETVSARFKGTPHDEFKHERGRKSSIVQEAADSLEKDTQSGVDEEVAQTTGSTSVIEDSGTEINRRRKDVAAWT